MATRTAYQKQADKRTKDALRLRARFDGRVRRHALALLAALTGAEDARNRINRINSLYGVDISTETLMVHDVRVSALGQDLNTALNAYSPGEEVQIFSPTVNGNNGTALALEAVFGEVASTPGNPGTPGTPAPATFTNTLQGPDGSEAGITLAAQAGDGFSFNALGTGGSAPMSMDLYVGSQQVASVAFLDRYNGQPFRFASPAGTFSGRFASGTVTL